jgi:hypothetical protein
MSSTSASIQIPAGPDRVWQLIGGFDSAPDWLTFILSSVVNDGGRVRTLTTKDGGVLLERLQAFDESRRTLTYSVDESPFPVTSYVSTLRVTEIPGRPDAALVECPGAFQPDGVSEDEAVSLFQGIYTDGLKAVQQAFGG